MFEVRRPEKKPTIVVIRNVTWHELAKYKKWKCENTKKGTQVAEFSTISTEIPAKKETFASIKK